MNPGKATKVNVADVEFAPNLRADEGWIDMQVQFLVGGHNADAEEVMFGRTIFKPGSRHDAHRHPDAEEVQYLVSGEGIILDGDDEIPVKPGDVVHTKRGQWHGFINTSETEDAELLWAWAGAGTRDEAGYEKRP